MRELDPSSLEALASSYRLASCIYAAAELGLPDLMVAGARDDEDLAREAGCHAPTLRRVLRMLAAEGVFTEDDDGRFGLTSFSHRLLSNVQDSARSMVLGWHALPAAYRAFGALSSAVRTGSTDRHRTTSSEVLSDESDLSLNT